MTGGWWTAEAYPVLCPSWSSVGTGGFDSLEPKMPGPSSGVEGSSDGDLRPKEGILLAMADRVPGMPMLAVFLYAEGRPAAQGVSS